MTVPLIALVSLCLSMGAAYWILRDFCRRLLAFYDGIRPEIEAGRLQKLAEGVDEKPNGL